MKLYPAIDLRGGQAVRLYQGDYDQMTVYNADPAAQAREFIAAGAKYLHVVDLDGAKDDTTANMTTIAAIAKQGGLFIEVGGGIRDEARIEQYLSLGVGRCILGTIAVPKLACRRSSPPIFPATAQCRAPTWTCTVSCCRFPAWRSRHPAALPAWKSWRSCRPWAATPQFWANPSTPAPSTSNRLWHCIRNKGAGRMITKRIIPCLDVKDGRVVKGVNFAGLQDMADPVEMARYYNAAGADELVFYDITASVEGRTIFTDILRRVASEIFIPLTVGGGINTLEDFDRVLKCGADKVSVNSGALKNPDLIPAAAQRYGNQCVVLSADVKRVDGQFRVFAKGGREDTGRDALDWISWCVDHGAGEICLNSIDTDGVRSGFDLEMLDAVAARVNVPIIASGGAGKKEDFLELFHHKGIDAGLAAGIFHQKLLTIRDLKEYLNANGVEMRL